MTDERRGCRPTSSTTTARAACRPRRRTSAPTCGAPSWPSGSASSASARSRAARAHTASRRAPGAPAASGQFYNWYDPRTGAKLDHVAADRRAADADPVLGGQRLARRRACGSSRLGAEARAPRRSAVRSMNSASTTGRSANRILFHYVPDTGEARAATTRSSARAGSPTTSGSPRADAAKGVLRALAQVPGHVRLELAGDPAGRPWRTYFGVDVFEGAYPYAGMRVTRRGAARCSRR